MKSFCFLSFVKEADTDCSSGTNTLGQYLHCWNEMLTPKETRYGNRVGEADSEKVQRDF